MGKFDKEFNEMVEAEEIMLQEVYEKKLQQLDAELEVRFNLPDNKGFLIVEPKYEYENTPEYIEHMKRGLEISVMEEKAKIQAALNNIERRKLERKEIEEMREAK